MKPILWRSPSNLALVKYWGKHGRQLPQNASISFTLRHSFTETALEYERKKGNDTGISLDFLFAGQANEAFAAKIVRFLTEVADELPFLREYHLQIASYNSFPHSAGIASSASSMSALALCLCSMEQALGRAPGGSDFLQRASYFARLFSGSACRSVYPKLALWGKHPDITGSTDEYALPMASEVHPIFHDFCDAILLVSRREKSVSSTAGHGLMKGHPFAAARYEQAQRNLVALLAAMRAGDLETFGRIVEEEALTLHGLMMNSTPSFILMEPRTLQLIQLLRDWRDSLKLPVYFSLDAGPNLHVLYPKGIEPQVTEWIQQEAAALCEDGKWIADAVGDGAAMS